MFKLFKKKIKETPKEPKIFTYDEYLEMMSVVSSPNGHYSWIRNMDGTITEYDNFNNSQRVLTE